MAFWVIVSDAAGNEKTLVSYAATEHGARTEAEKRELTVEEVTPISNENDAAELEIYGHLSVSSYVRFQLFCLTAGQVVAGILCFFCFAQVITFVTFANSDATASTIEISFMALIVGPLLFCTFAALIIVFAYIKKQLAPRLTPSRSH